MKYAPLTGLIAAPFTAFHEDGRLNPALIEKQAASLRANGVSGAFICGTTGEGASLSNVERREVAEEWMRTADPSLRVIVHVGHTSLVECRALANHAQQIGASGIGCIAPYFFKPSTIEELTAFCAQVAAAAPELPFYYYHLPSMTGVSLPAAAFLRAAGKRIPNLAGVKFTFEDLQDYADCVQLDGGRYDIVFGRDELLVESLKVGAHGAIGSTYNFAAPIYHRILTAFSKGDLATAQTEQVRVNHMIDAFIRHGGLRAGKAMMRMIGLDCGPTRLPLSPLSVKEESELRLELERAGFFEYCSRV